MKTRKSQLTLAASALAMAVALAGCGGGGGKASLNGGSTGVGTHAASFAETWASQRSDIETALSSANTVVSNLTNMSSGSDVSAAEMAVGAIQVALDAGTHISSADITRYQHMQMSIQSALNARKDGIRLTGDLTMARADVSKLTADLGAANDKVMMLETDLGAANDKVMMLETDLGVANAKVETLEDQIERQDGDIQGLNEQLTDEKLKVAGLETDLQSEKGMVAQLQTDLQSEKDMVAQLQTDLQSEKDMVAQLQTDLQSEKDMVAQLQGQLDMVRQGPERTAIMNAISALNDALGKIDASATAEEVKAADDALTAAWRAIATAIYLPQDEKDGFSNDVTGIAGQLDAAKMDRTTSIAAATKEMAIMTEAGQGAGQNPANPDAGLGGSDHVNTDGTLGNADDPYMLEISRDRDGTEVKITDFGMMGDDDPKFIQAMDLGGGTTMHTRMMEADDDDNMMEEVVVVSTDIEAPKATAFTMVYPIDSSTGVSTDTTNDSPDTTYEALTIDGTSADVRGRVMSSAFTIGSDPNQSVLTFDDDDSGTANNDEAFETAGTYDGAMGTYRCNGSADCTVTLDAKGMITAMSAGWIFTPAMNAMVDVPDADYLHYGFWLKKTTDKDGMLTYNEVETFAMSSVDASGSLSSVLGKATYEGGATGVYVHTVNNPDGTRKQATSGHFTADAKLEATFGQDQTIAPNMLYMLTGTINNFMLSGGEDNQWSVALESSAASDTGSHSGTAKGGNGDGSFSAMFHGATGDDNDVQPSSIVGEFNAGFTNGSVAGAFGARKMEMMDQ